MDFRNLAMPQLQLNKEMHYPGITYNRMMANVLHAMGVDRKEWEVPGKPGFGQWYAAAKAVSRYPSGVLDSASNPLPVITKG